ncbi:MAG: sirohydrochlorin chelatase [Pseudomonadota bacterium]
MSEQHRIILLAHGSSDERWCRTFEQLAAPTVQSIPGARIAYMELAEPSLETIVKAGVGDGVRTFRVIPLFLAAGRHLRKDVPAMISALEESLDVTIGLAPPIGENPQLGEAIRDVVEQELAK